MTSLINENGRFEVVDGLAGLSIGIVYFDDRSVVYVSRSVFENIKTGNIKKLEYAVLTYQRAEKDIDAVAREIVTELENCPPGQLAEEIIMQLESGKSPNPKWILNPNTGASD